MLTANFQISKPKMDPTTQMDFTNYYVYFMFMNAIINQSSVFHKFTFFGDW